MGTYPFFSIKVFFFFLIRVFIAILLFLVQFIAALIQFIKITSFKTCNLLEGSHLMWRDHSWFIETEFIQELLELFSPIHQQIIQVLQKIATESLKKKKKFGL